MLVLAGIMDFGFLLYSRMSIINASREGAHAAIIVSDPGTITNMGLGAAESAAAQGGVSIGESNVAITCLNTSVNLSNPSGIDCSAAKNGDSVVVRIDYTYHTFFPLLFGATLNLTSTTQMTYEGGS